MLTRFYLSFSAASGVWGKLLVKLNKGSVIKREGGEGGEKINYPEFTNVYLHPLT
jgi:hypothetical protein